MSRINATLRGTITTNLYGVGVEGERWIRLQYPIIPDLADCVVEIQPGGTIDLQSGKVVLKWILVDPETIDAWDPLTEEGTAPPVPDELDDEVLPVPQHLAGTAGGTDPFHVDIAFDDPQRPDLSYRARFRLLDGGGGTPGNWSEVDFTSPTILGGRVFVTLYPTTPAAYEVQMASVGPGKTTSEYSTSLFVSTAPPALDFNRAQNSFYLAII
jgi:hypothetical protein